MHSGILTVVSVVLFLAIRTSIGIPNPRSKSSVEDKDSNRNKIIPDNYTRTESV